MENANIVMTTRAAAAIIPFVEIREPVMLWGPPGIGKSSIVLEVAEHLGMRVVDVRAALLEPVDLMGVPSVVDGTTRWNTPSWLPTDPEEPVLLFLDELSNASEAVQNALLQLVQDRRCGDYILPPSVAIVGAGNRREDGTYSKAFSKALGSRFGTHLEMAVSLDQWCRWAVGAGIAAEVVGFVRLRPDLLHQFDSKAKGNSFPCPRTWEKVSKVLGRIPKDLELAVFSGALGDGCGAEFTSFLRIYRDLPSIDAIFMSPDSVDVPTNPSVMFALCAAMSRRISTDNADRAFRYISRMRVEYQAACINDAMRHTPKLAGHKSFTEWCIDNGHLIS